MELVNAGPGAQSVAAWKLTGVNGLPVATLPAWSVPEGAYLVVVFDAGVNDSDFGDGSGTFHVPGGPALDDTLDACALFSGTPSPATLQDFVAWGIRDTFPNGDAFDWAVGQAQWLAGTAVQVAFQDTVSGFLHELPPGESVGRDSLSTDTNQTGDWATWGGEHALKQSPGGVNLGTAENLGPIPSVAVNAEWLVMIYMDIRDPVFIQSAGGWIKTMELIPYGTSGRDVHVAIQTNRAVSGTGGARYFIEDHSPGSGGGGSSSLLSPGEPWSIDRDDITHPDSLRAFIDWANAKFPSQNQALILVGHGRGWKGTLLYAESTEYLDMGELATALNGAGLETVVFNSCQMGMIEVYHQLPSEIQTAVGSEKEVMWFPFDSFLNWLVPQTNTGNVNPVQFATRAAMDYGSSMKAGSAKGWYTVNAVQPGPVRTTLSAAVDALAGELLATMEDPGKKPLIPTDNHQVLISNAIEGAADEFKSDIDQTDLKRLCRQLELESDLPPSLHTAAKTVRTLLEVGNGVVLNHTYNPNLEGNPAGVSIAVPQKERDGSSNKPGGMDRPFALKDPVAFRYDSSNDISPYTNPVNHPFPAMPGLGFVHDTQWSMFLSRFHEPVAVAMITRVDEVVLKPPRRDVVILPGQDVSYTSKGSSDSEVSSHKVLEQYWDMNDFVDADAFDADRDNNPAETIDDNDSEAVSVDDPGPFNDEGVYRRTLHVWNHHHDWEAEDHWEIDADAVTITVSPPEPPKEKKEAPDSGRDPDGGTQHGDRGEETHTWSWDFEGGSCPHDSPGTPLGLDGSPATEGWTSVDLSGAGDLAGMRSLGDLGVPANGLSGCVLTFFDPNGATHPAGQNNLAVSPVIDLAEGPPPTGSAYFLSFDAYLDLPLAGGQYLVWKVRSGPVNDQGTLVDEWTGWQDYRLRYYEGEGIARSWEFDVTPLIPTFAESIQVAVGIADRTLLWRWRSTPHSGIGPFVDNVRLDAVPAVGARIVARDCDLLQDAFPADGLLDSTSVCRVDPPSVEIMVDSLLTPLAAVPRDAADIFVRPGNPLGPPPWAAVHFEVTPGPGIDTGALAGWLSGFWIQDGLRCAYLGRVDIPDSTGPDTSLVLFDLHFGPEDPQYGLTVDNEVFPDDLFTPGTTITYHFTAGYGLGGDAARLPETGRSFTFRCLPSGPPAGACLLVVDATEDPADAAAFRTALDDLGLSSLTDVYRVRAAGAALGNSLGARAGQAPGWETGPTAAQLAPYRGIVWLGGDRSEALLARQDYGDPAQDLDLLTAWAAAPADTGFLWLRGRGLGADLLAGDGPGADFAADFLTVAPRAASGLGGLDCVAVAASSPPWPHPDVLRVTGTGFPTPLDPVPAAPGALDPVPAAAGVTSVLTWTAANAAVSLLHDGPADTTGTGGPFRTLLDGFGPRYLFADGACASLPVETAWTAYVLSQYAGGCVGGVGTTLSSPEPTPGLVFRLLPPAPNPLRGSDSQIHFTLNAPGRAVVDVFDVSGRCVRVVLDAKLPAGDGRVAWDLRDDAGHRAAAGLYFIRLRQGEHVASRKLVVLR